MPSRRITNQVEYVNVHKQQVITEQEKKFCELVLRGVGNRDAVFEAGYYPMDKKDDPVYKNRASAKSQSLLMKKGIRIYLNKNRKIIRVDSDGCDRRALKIHIYDIAMGNITQNVMTKEGEQVQVPPSFKDQITAAALFAKMDNDDRMVKISQVEATPDVVTEEIGQKVSKFISKFNTREVTTANPDIVRRLEGDVRDVDYKELDKAMASYVEEEVKLD